MDNAEKKRHLLRRFGFGASLAEQQALEKLSVEQAVQALLKTDAPDLGVPFQYAISPKNEAPDVGSWRWRSFWVMQMLVSPNPLREKMALFWHSHFAVSDGKVEHGPMMLDYMTALRTDPAGKFGDILHRLVKTPAFLKNLDVRSLMKGRPNENFAREVLELYTLGIGNYTETDIKEISRALTGWSFEDFYWTLGKTEKERLGAMMRDDLPAGSFAYLPGVRDTGVKTILGKTGPFDGDQVLDMLAVHPTTARRLCEKLWSFFGSEKTAPKAVERMAKKFLASKGDIRETLLEMTKTPEFWADANVGTMIKSPVDFAIGYARAMNLGMALRDQSDPKLARDAAVKADLFDVPAGVAYHMGLMGQDLLFPPSVAGWDGHEAWISSNNMLRRRNFAGAWTYVKTKKDGKDQWVPGAPLLYVMSEVRKAQPASPQAVADSLCRVFDARLTGDSLAALTETITKNGGVDALKDDGWLAGQITKAMALVRMAPEFHLC